MNKATSPSQRKCPKCHRVITHTNQKNAKKMTGRLCRSCAANQRVQRNGDIAQLLLETSLAWYWNGFLLADGNFYRSRLRLALAQKDKTHLYKFAKYINYRKDISEYQHDGGLLACYIAIQDKTLCPILMQRYGFKERKTFNPPSVDLLSSFAKEKLDCIIAGFIDGDGCIKHLHQGSRDFMLRIKKHASWLSTLDFFGRHICEDGHYSCKINACGYADLQITNSIILKRLKKRVLRYNIPLMPRKWDIIDLGLVGKYEKASILREKVLNDLRTGYSLTATADRNKTSYWNVLRIRKAYL